MKISPLMVAPFVIMVGVIGVLLFGLGGGDDNSSARSGQTAPSVSALEVLGERELLTDELLQYGGVKIVNFWASWCAPCRAEHDQLKTLAGSGVTVFGVNYKDKPVPAEAFLTELGDPFAAIGMDTSGRVAIDWGLIGVPETFILTAEGEITFRFAGPITPDVLETIIMPEIEKAAQ